MQCVCITISNAKRNLLGNVSNQIVREENKAVPENFNNEPIDLSIRLFKSARAEYTEVLLTQREALESKIEIIETKRDQ